MAASWNGAARGIPNAPRPLTIQTTMGNDNNGTINSSSAIKCWSNGAHENVREGQIMFAARNNPRTDSTRDVWSRHLTEASLQHLNMMCELGWKAARQALVQGNNAMPHGISITVAEFDALSEWDIYEYIGDREKDIPDDMPTLKAACKLLQQAQFKYLLPVGVMMHWNLFGAVSNISYGTAPQAAVNEYAKRVVVVNHNVAKRCTLANIWGDKSRLLEGGEIGLVCKRRRNADGTPGAPEIVPWSQVDAVTPAFVSRSYPDEMGRDQKGYYLFVGTCHEIDNKELSDRHRRDAVGNTGKPAMVAHNAYGTLPRIVVQWGM